jgi:hypothetical protein
MTEAIFTDKKIKKLSLQEVPASFGFVDTEIPGFFKYFFMRYSPGNTGYWYCQYEQVSYLLR